MFAATAAEWKQHMTGLPQPHSSLNAPRGKGGTMQTLATSVNDRAVLQVALSALQKAASGRMPCALSKSSQMLHLSVSTAC
jgi:hypothetical protein